MDAYFVFLYTFRDTMLLYTKTSDLNADLSANYVKKSALSTPSSLAKVSPCSSKTSPIATCPPLLTNSAAVAAPIPRLPPVTSKTLPLN